MINYKEIGIKAGLPRRQAEEIAPDLKKAVEDAFKKDKEKKQKKKDNVESKDITEIDNTYKK